MWRGVVLHLSSGLKHVLARASWCTTQSRVPDPTRQSAVRDLHIILVSEQLLYTHRVAACTCKGVFEDGPCRWIHLAFGGRDRLFAGPQNTANGITRQLQNTADLA
jgi:hypothetical protein